MSKTNQVCITCAQRDTCQYYDPNRTLCVPVKVSDYGQFAGSLRPTIDWEQVRIQTAMYAMQGQLANQVLTENMIESVENVADFPKVLANASARFADALVAELQKKGGKQ